MATHPARPTSRIDATARWGALLFFTGGLVAAGSLAVPHGPVRNEGVALLDALGAVLLGPLLYAMAGRVRPWMLHALMVLGNLQVAVGMQFLGRGPMSVTATGFFVWTSVFAFYFFSWQAALAHLVVIASGLAITLWALHEPAGPGIWLVTMGTAGVAGAVVGALAGQLRLAARTDGLTGLPNRWHWDEALDRELHRAGRTGEPLCVASIDLDGFKALNDAKGHQAGDVFLRELARSWESAIRGNDLLARYGGDEFAVLLPDATRDQALVVVERMRAAAPDACFCSGVAEWDRREDAASLLARADGAVYRAKAGGRNRTVVDGEAAR
jgi:diguanylate cyclase (GGDEF)-like protein